MRTAVKLRVLPRWRVEPVIRRHIVRHRTFNGSGPMQTVPRLEVLEAKAKRYPQMDPVACEAYLMLRQVGDCMRSTLEKRLAVEGISHGRFMLLAILDRQPEKPLPASELAEDAG